LSNAPTIERIGDRWKFRASSLGKCPRALLATLYGFTPDPPPAFLAKAAKRGQAMEPHIIEDLKEQGWIFETQQELINLEIDDDLLVRGHTDGRASLQGRTFVVEAKSMSDNQYKLWLDSLEDGKATFSNHMTYSWQLSAYMHATGLPAVYAVKNPTSWSTEVTIIEEPPHSLEDIRLRLRSIVDNYDPSLTLMQADPRVLACDLLANKFFCNQSQFHDKTDRERGRELDDRPIVEALAGAYLDIMAREKQIKQSKEDLRQKIIDQVGPSTIETSTGKKIDVTKKEPSRRLNKKKAEADGVNLDKYREAGEEPKASYVVKVKE